MLTEVTALAMAYRYWAILLLSLVEAPLMSIVIGFLVATGHVNPYLAFGCVVGGDFVGDSALYVFGRYFRRRFEKIGLRLKLSTPRALKMLDYFKMRDRRAIVISKLVHGIGFTGLVVAGSLRIPFGRFIVTCVIVTVCQSAMLAVVGMLSGEAYQSFASLFGYLDVVIAAIFLLGLFFVYTVVIGKIGDRQAND